MENPYLTGALGRLFVRTTTPIVLVMLVNGLFNLVDAAFLGLFVGADALAAVTLMFPLQMILIALGTWIGGGFASLYARWLGAGDRQGAGQLFASAHGYALVLGFFLVGLFTAGGSTLIGAMVEREDIARMAFTYIAIIIGASPMTFLLYVHSDALRCEGQLKRMTLVTVLSSIANVVFNYLLIAVLEWGVAGSAWGTVAAQLLSFAIVLFWRRGGRARVPLRRPGWHDLAHHGREIATLGAPVSLSYIGLALTTGAIILNVQIWGGTDNAATLGAFGIVNRLMTFFFLPLLGLSLAFQAIAGNNFGAGALARVNAGTRMALIAGLAYCALSQLFLQLGADRIAYLFVDDATVAAETGRILPLITLLLFAMGPRLILSSYFQSLGDARRAAVLSLTQPFVLSIPLIFALPHLWGESGIWYAAVISDAAMIGVCALVLAQNARANDRRWGVFHRTVPLPSSMQPA